MTTETANAIKLFVQSHDKPSPAELIEADWPKLEMVTFLVTKLAGTPVAANINEQAGVAEFLEL